MPQNSNFRLPRCHPFFPKSGSYGNGAKSRSGHPRVHLGAIGVPLGKKNGSKPLQLPCHKNSNFRLPRGHPFFAKNGIYGYAAKSRWEHPMVHLGANGVPLGKKKMGQNLEVTVMAPNHGGDPLGSISGPMGYHWVQKMGQNVENLHARKFEFWTTPRSSIFPKKWKLRLWHQITVGTP